MASAAQVVLAQCVDAEQQWLAQVEPLPRALAQVASTEHATPLAVQALAVAQQPPWQKAVLPPWALQVASSVQVCVAQVLSGWQHRLLSQVKPGPQPEPRSQPPCAQLPPTLTQQPLMQSCTRPQSVAKLHVPSPAPQDPVVPEVPVLPCVPVVPVDPVVVLLGGSAQKPSTSA